MKERYYQAYQWLLSCEAGVWFSVSEEQDGILRDIWRVIRGEIELTFRNGEVKITRWEDGKPC